MNIFLLKNLLMNLRGIVVYRSRWKILREHSNLRAHVQVVETLTIDPNLEEN